MNARLFHAILRELVDENPFACRALLQLLEVEFTDRVETLAVTTGANPCLLVNLEFVARHCRTEAQVKAVICHEFLHVLLRHTERVAPQTPAEHLALDAVINAIIHRKLGDSYSSMMGDYYAREFGVRRLLRPWTRDEMKGPHADTQIGRAWTGLYKGWLVADDIRALADDLDTKAAAGPWLGNHAAAEDVSLKVAAVLGRAMKSMNGDGIWREPKSRGVGASAYVNRVTAADSGVERWRRATLDVLRRHLQPDPRGAHAEAETRSALLPVLSAGDRRSFARALWSPLLPAAAWPIERPARAASAQVYLDVSGSMSAEMPLIIALLARLGRHLRRPLWAFSDEVAPAEIRGGQLHASTSGGTRLGCVLAHLAKTRPAAAVIVTDGYIEPTTPAEVKALAGIRLHAVVTRDGNTGLLAKAGIPFTQLGRLPR